MEAQSLRELTEHQNGPRWRVFEINSEWAAVVFHMSSEILTIVDLDTCETVSYFGGTPTRSASDGEEEAYEKAARSAFIQLEFF